MSKVLTLANEKWRVDPWQNGRAAQDVGCESLSLCPYSGYAGQDFDWADYLKQCGAEAAPQRCFPPVRTPLPRRRALGLPGTAVPPVSMWLSLSPLAQPK